ncbi:CDP-glycerol:glycerophosphate glycerophosphotransferase [Anaerostipes caccae]|jgi:CDP-glycerol glycerophosphotransferase|uniref:CDP-glycerol:glycerophosphate glycerophosphotransferase n=1 Tax=Anaerostipes caccae TaxID=105841 RepID=UPI001D08FEF3|nr:CDP-glycerol glycerophosphotransferase family protein [Anaerostipes caccae]
MKIGGKDLEKKVSIIVPVYGVEQWLPRCLDSLVNQTLQGIEIIVVNDGSPDNSQSIIDQYEKKYPHLVKGYKKENGGLSDARNFGLQYAIGEYIAFVDSDDYVDISMYEKMYNKAIEEDADAVTCGYFSVNEKKNQRKSRQMGTMHLYGKSLEEVPVLLMTFAPFAWNKMIRRSIFEETNIKFPKGIIYEDICTMYPLLLYCNKISKVNEELYYYIEEREGSITATYSPKKIQLLDSLKILNDHYIKAGKFEEFHDVLVAFNLRHIYFRFKEFSKYKKTGFQLKLVSKSFKHLKKYFPDWRKNSGYYQNFTLAKDRTIKRWFYKRRLYWYIVSLMPLKLILLYRKFEKHWRNPKNIFKYYYTWCSKHLKVKEKNALFESFHGTDISDSPLAMMQELQNRKGYKIYVTTNNYHEHKEFLEENHLKAVPVKLKSFKYQKILATSKYLINNVSFPTYFIKRKEQIHLNTWHGTPLKTLGKNMRKGIESMYNIQHNFLQADYLLFPNEFTKKHIMEDYNLNHLYTGKTIVHGYPRNSIFMDKEAGAELKNNLGFQDKILYTYMPTWRGANSYKGIGHDYIDTINDILNRVDQVLSDDEIFFVNLHPNVKSEVDYRLFQHIRPFPENIPKYEFINCTDVLITDYSSIFFDFSITRKPIVLFMYDYEAYMEERGTYLNAKELPFYKVYDLEKFITGIRNKEFLKSTYKGDRSYYETYINYDEKNAAGTLNDGIFEGNWANVKIEDYSFNKDHPKKLYVFQSKVDTKEEFDQIIKENQGPDTIFAIRKKYFDAKMNHWLFDEYNDKLVYIIYGYTRCLTWLELKKWQKSNEKYRRLARERGFQRSLPNITITNKNEIRNVI